VPQALYPLSLIVISSPFFSGVTLPCAESWILIFYPLVHLLSVSRGFFPRGFDLSSLASEVSPMTFSRLLCARRHRPYSFFSLQSSSFRPGRPFVPFVFRGVLTWLSSLGKTLMQLKTSGFLRLDGRASDSKRIGSLVWGRKKIPWTSAPFWDLLLAIRDYFFFLNPGK
jgi:hypothetical protein